MRLPFFNKPSGPVRLSFPDHLAASYVVYFKSLRPEPPAPESLKPVVDGWLDRHAEDPLRGLIKEFIERGLLTLDVQERASFPEPPPELLGAWQPGELEERRFGEATHVVLVLSHDLLLPPRVGLWTATAAARALAEASGGVILDPDFPRLLSTDTHAEDLPVNGRIFAARHIMVPHSVDRRGLSWLTTKGMSKFALPELEVRDAPPNLAGPLTSFISGVAQHLILASLRASQEKGDPVREIRVGPEIRLEASEIARAYAGDEEAPPAEGARGWTPVGLEFHPGKKGHDDFLRIVPPPGTKSKLGEWLNSALSDLFGTEDTLRNVKSDSESMEAAHLQAVSELPQVRQRFQAGLDPGATLIIKHGFPTGEDHHEFMWLVVNTWKGDRIQAQLANEPQIRMDLRAGQSVELREGDVFDWAIMHSDGRTEGGYTNRVVEAEGS